MAMTGPITRTEKNVLGVTMAVRHTTAKKAGHTRETGANVESERPKAAASLQKRTPGDRPV